MRLKNKVILILLFLGLTLNVGAQTYNSATNNNRGAERVLAKTHIVRIGETVYSIANKYQVTIEQIYEINPGTKNGINVGQTLYIPNSIEEYTTPQPQTTDTKQQAHTIQPKETLYSVSQNNRITVAELVRANPGLSEETFSIGRTINIPSFAIPKQVETVKEVGPKEVIRQHKVKKQETLYSLAKGYNITIEELKALNPNMLESGLQEGTIINIPDTATVYEFDPNNPGRFPTNFVPQDGVVRIALLLPFIEGSKSVSQEKITEYYEGFLLAVQRMKEKGLNAEIYTFDIGSDNKTSRLESILGTNELNSLNLVVGGISDKQVQLISRFSKRTGIAYVAPFGNKYTGVESNPNMFQVANSHSNLFPKIAKGFAKKFASYNIVFLSEMGSDNNKKDFAVAVQKELKTLNIPFKITPTTPSIIDDLNAVLDQTRRNIVIPTSSSENSLRRALEAINVISRDKTQIQLFGYPEWQTYINKAQKLHQSNTYIYSMFYLDNYNPEAQLFSDRYKKWYNKSLVISYPKFAHMGYDTGITFLTALQMLGHNFATNFAQLEIPTLQSAFYFELVRPSGGYINTGVYFINLKPENVVDKIEISKQ